MVLGTAVQRTVEACPVQERLMPLFVSSMEVVCPLENVAFLLSSSVLNHCLLPGPWLLDFKRNAFLKEWHIHPQLLMLL